MCIKKLRRKKHVFVFRLFVHVLYASSSLSLYKCDFVFEKKKCRIAPCVVFCAKAVRNTGNPRRVARASVF